MAVVNRSTSAHALGVRSSTATVTTSRNGLLSSSSSSTPLSPPPPSLTSTTTFSSSPLYPPCQNQPVWCEPCGHWKLPRVHHCRVCRRCVQDMDHHCPWIDNCVGHDNWHYFMLFVVCTAAVSIGILVAIGLRASSSWWLLHPPLAYIAPVSSSSWQLFFSPTLPLPLSLDPHTLQPVDPRLLPPGTLVAYYSPTPESPAHLYWSATHCCWTRTTLNELSSYSCRFPPLDVSRAPPPLDVSRALPPWEPHSNVSVPFPSITSTTNNNNVEQQPVSHCSSKRRQKYAHRFWKQAQTLIYHEWRGHSSANANESTRIAVALLALEGVFFFSFTFYMMIKQLFQWIQHEGPIERRHRLYPRDALSSTPITTPPSGGSHSHSHPHSHSHSHSGTFSHPHL